MGEVLQANIFFFITSVAVIVFTIFLCVATYHLIKILSSIRKIAHRIEQGSEFLAEDITSVRNFFTEGSLIARVMGLLGGPSGERESPKSSRRSSTKSSQKLSINEE